MIVFKCYMKILRQNVTLVIIYLGIFFSVALVMQMAAGKSEDSLYANTSIDIGVVKEDQGVLAQGFVDYLNTIHNVIPMKNNPEVLQENLFYRNVEYIVQIPDDFYEACIQGNQPLKVTKVPGSYSSYYVDQQISSYISTIRTYVAAGFSQEEAVQAVKTEVHKPVTKISSDSASSDLVPYTYYFRYIPYLFLGALCYTMGYILMAVLRFFIEENNFKEKEVTYKEYQERSAFTQKHFRKKNAAAIDAYEEADKYITEHIKAYYVDGKAPKRSELAALSKQLKDKRKAIMPEHKAYLLKHDMAFRYTRQVRQYLNEQYMKREREKSRQRTQAKRRNKNALE